MSKQTTRSQSAKNQKRVFLIIKTIKHLKEINELSTENVFHHFIEKEITRLKNLKEKLIKNVKSS